MPNVLRIWMIAAWYIRSEEESTLKLGIIGAMELEIETLLEAMVVKSSAQHAGSTYYEGTLEGTEVVLVQCGIGKVNAAMCVQILCDCYGVTALVNTGIAGSLCKELDIGDLVISKDAMYHDFDCCAFGYPMGNVPGMDLTFVADPALCSLAFEAAEKVNPGHNHIGRIVSGDQFICEKEKKQQIIAISQGLCTEMEGAAIAHTACRNGVPFVILRAISDKADDSADMDFAAFEKQAAYRCAEVTRLLAWNAKSK